MVTHVGVTKSIFAHLIRSKGVDFPRLREGGEDDGSRFGQFGIQQSGISVRQ